MGENFTADGIYDSGVGKVYVKHHLQKREDGAPLGGYEEPYEYTGNYPVHKPTFTGNTLQHFILLDDEWVILVSDTIDEIFDQANTASGGTLQQEVDDWVNSFTGSSPDWGARDGRGPILTTYSADIRDAIEIPLGTASNFTITSSDDSNYNPGVNPSVSNYMMWMGDAAGRYGPYEIGGHVRSHTNGYAEPLSGVWTWAYKVYSYLKMPTRMVDGSTYTITLGTGGSVTFDYDLDATVSRAIKVNQVGYLPDAGTKKAYIGGYLWDQGAMDLSHTATFEVVNMRTGGVAYSGSVVLSEADPVFKPSMDSGTTDGTTANKLVDAGQNFNTTVNPDFIQPVHANNIYAVNTTDTTEARVTAVDSDSTLSLDADIFTSGEDYIIQNRTKLYGEDVYEMVFDDLDEPGEYFIRVPGVGRSWPFRVNADIYSCALYTTGRAFYHQRFGTALDSEYTRWARDIPDISPGVYESDHVQAPLHNKSAIPGYSEQAAIAATINTAGTRHDLPRGGHCDAADFDVRELHFTCPIAMLYAYHFYPTKFTDGQWDLPGAGDGIPDILKEARWSLEFWRASQTALGGVSADCETNAHYLLDQMDSGGNKEFWAFGNPTRWDTLLYAGAAAMYAHLIEPFDSDDAALYQASAESAYTWGSDPANDFGTYTINNGGSPNWTFTDADSWHEPYLYFAKNWLYVLTGDITYITDAPSVETLNGTIPGAYVWTWTRQDYSPFLHYSVIDAYEAGATTLATIAANKETGFLNQADSDINNNLTDMPYENTMNRTNAVGFMAWGNGQAFNYNPALIIAHKISGLDKYRDAAIQNMDYTWGCNCMGICWTSGLGSVYPANYIQHEHSNFRAFDDPIPGITPYGITGGPIDGDFHNSNYRVRPSDPATTAIASATQTGGTATITTVENHGLADDNSTDVHIADLNESEYNGYKTDVTVTGDKTFTYSIDSGAASPATGTGIWRKSFRTPANAIAQSNMPLWRKWSPHQSLNVPQSEMTISETASFMMLSCAFLASVGWTPDGTEKRQPRQKKDIHGRWLLP